jgi:hypothetical protein
MSGQQHSDSSAELSTSGSGERFTRQRRHRMRRCSIEMLVRGGSSRGVVLAPVRPITWFNIIGLPCLTSTILIDTSLYISKTDATASPP